MRHDSQTRFFRLSPLLLTLLALLVAGAPASAQTNHDVSVVDTQFIPREITIQAGDSVTWTSAGTALQHNVRADDDSFRCAQGCDGMGGDGFPSLGPWSVTLTFDQPGDIGYYCELHGVPGNLAMAGVIHVEGGSTANPGNLTLSSPNYPVGEGGGSVTVRVNRVNGSDGAVSVSYGTGNGTATAPADYQSASGTLSWGNGDASAKTFQVPIVDDDEDEPQERFNVGLSNPGGGATLLRSNATVTINDNDESGDDGGDDGGTGGPGQLRFQQDLYEVGEADGVAMVTVERSGGSGGQVTARLTARGGTATEDADFLPVSETVTFGGGVTGPRQVMIPILQDDEDEGVETVHVELSAPTGGAGLGAPSRADVAILDDEGLDDCDADDPLALCLGRGGRFKVQVSFRAPNDNSTGRGDKLPLIREVGGEIVPVLDSGLFTFFDPNNAELLVKVLNVCSFANRFWVFYAATTNVELTLTVTDTERQEVFFRSNPLGQTAETVLDTQAFATCP